MSADTPDNDSDTRRLQNLHDAERLMERIVRVGIQRLVQQLDRDDPDFYQVSEVTQALGRILELRVQVRELITQATLQREREGTGAASTAPEAEDLSELELQREANHEDGEEAQVSREVPPPLDIGK